MIVIAGAILLHRECTNADIVAAGVKLWPPQRAQVTLIDPMLQCVTTKHNNAFAIIGRSRLAVCTTR